MSNGHRLKVCVAFAVKHSSGLVVHPDDTSQAAIFLARMLQRLHMVSDVWLCPAVEAADPLFIAQAGMACINAHTAVEECDLFIDFGGQGFSSAQIDQIHSRGGRVVFFCSENAMLAFMHEIAHGLAVPIPRGTRQYDAAWVYPHLMQMNRSLLTAMVSENITSFPLLWDPWFIQYTSNHLRRNLFWRPPTSVGQSIASFAPNLAVDRTFHFPLLVAERAFEQAPDKIRRMLLFNTLHLRELEHINEMILALNIGKQTGGVSLEGRIHHLDLLGREVDVAVSHQWSQEFSYENVEILWLGYPLVHNSKIMQEVGYYYPEFRPTEGGDALVIALTDHAHHWHRQSEARRELFWQLSIDNPQNQARCQELILRAFEGGGE